MKWSLEGKLSALLLLVLVLGAGMAAALSIILSSALLATVLVVIIGLLPLLWLTKRVTRPLRELLRGMASAVDSYRDGDFSISLNADRSDELGELLKAHNDLGRALLEQRFQLAERELLLQTVTQKSPVAIVLLDPGERVAYANFAARHLLNGGSSLTGQEFGALLQLGPETLRVAVRAGEDSLFTTEIDGMKEIFHLTKQSFRLRGRPHTLYMLNRVTREMSRREVVIWKDLIRLLSHELNNSLAPISSLAQSAPAVLRRGETEELTSIFAAISERAEHLQSFIQSYATFARLPEPQSGPVDWKGFVDEVALQYRCRISGELPTEPGWFDRSKIGQALINVLKNAHEAGSPVEDVQLSIHQTQTDHRIEVIDRGSGMSETVLSQALLPFYSTKRSGTGLGLPLVREIVEAHAGRVTLSNRIGGGLCVTMFIPRRKALAAFQGQQKKSGSGTGT